MNRKIVAGLSLFVMAIYVMNTRTSLPVETQNTYLAEVTVLPFGSVSSGNKFARRLARRGAEHGTDQMMFDGVSHVDAGDVARSGAEDRTDQATSDSADHVEAGALARSGAELGGDQVAFNQTKYKLVGLAPMRSLYRGDQCRLHSWASSADTLFVSIFAQLVGIQSRNL